ncbi:P-loop containing nucleoside triphosphate hydrolase protein [Laetiporus sulphureus 93-53]|uniref:RNA helicase n=1 Tax=Laetiporus sulphureus 93-53 TaxID=1314785 RepID=A0A165BBF2_9APHY|nr:P-loop containing nucleoside triphosphate hydrolase protein [Laetiporus sulphureus 93-53]KZT00673.1 P-loop containing nucleoside triphosphate hydrolase protein [Laetiporus sulphureus 93-53]
MAQLAPGNYCPNVLYSTGCTDAACGLVHDVKFCQACGIIFHPAKLYNQHISGKKHQERVTITATSSSNRLRCPICAVQVSGRPNWQQHVAGGKHRSRASQQGVSPAVEPEDANVLRNARHCTLCSRIISFSSWSSHVRGAEHQRQEQHASFRAAFEQAERNRNGIKVMPDGDIDFGIVTATNASQGVTIMVVVQSDNPSSQIRVVSASCIMKNPNSACPFTAVLDGSGEVRAARDTRLKLTFRHQNVGRYEGRLEIHFQRSGQNFMIVRRFKATIGDTADHELLKVMKPYVKHRRVPWRRASQFLPGSPPPAMNAVPWKKKLEMYPTPENIIAALRARASPLQIIEFIRQSILPATFNETSHGLYLQVLLWIEEYRMEQDMRSYDLADATFKKEGRYHFLDVPGLAEKRPSVLIGDRIEVQTSGATDDRCFEGWVHLVRRDDVGLDFHPSFKPIGSQRYNVRFQLNRIPLRRQHQALRIYRSKLARLLFPQPQHVGLTASVSATDLSLVYFDARVGNNAAQATAVRSIVELRKRAAPFIIFGPPGTGKTVTIVEAIRQLLARNSQARILACAPSNSAADILAQRLSKLGADQLFRHYAVSRKPDEVPNDLRPFIFLNTQGNFSVPPLERLSQFRVIVCTCLSASFPYGVGLRAGHFSHIFVDEAGQASEPEVMTAIKPMVLPSTQVILSGDPRQLGPIIRSTVARELGLGRSYLERLMERELYQPPTGRNRSYVKLVKNFRSHGAILAFPNQQFYDDELQVSGSPSVINAYVGSRHLENLKFPVIFHAVSGKDDKEANSPSYFNVDEIIVGKKYIADLLADRRHPIKKNEIGVIAPYHAHVRKFRKALSQKVAGASVDEDDAVKVASVEEFQGDERKVIILSTVRSSRDLLEYDARYALGFVANPRRFNVAVTRAQALLIVIGDPSVLSLDPLWRAFLNYVYLNDGWRGEPITWDPHAPVDDNGAFAQQLQQNSLAHITTFMQQTQELAGDEEGEVTGADVEEGAANTELVHGGVQE